MDYRRERFDTFGFESPFAESDIPASAFSADGEGGFEAFAWESPYPAPTAWRGEFEAESGPLNLSGMLGIRGRFDDPARNPAIDMDGTKFDAFLQGGNRQEFAAKWLASRPALAESIAAPRGDLKSGDIAKAWFVIHDVGVKSSLSDTRFNAKDTKKKSVHGFVNRAGNYAATHDFAKRKSGTIYEFVSKRGQEIAGGKTVNIETVPDIENVTLKADGTLPAPRDAGNYASIGFRRNRKMRKGIYYKWTKAAFEVIADLYILASARAGHLLTMTAHKEMDRNLGRSVIWREYSAAEIARASTKYLKAARDRPSDYHGDPYGFDFQALYDVVTRKLNALGGRQMPAGARYGINPLRVRKADGEDIGNGSSHKHEFPHQSSPDIKRDTGLKAAGWWQSAKIGEAFGSDFDEAFSDELDEVLAEVGHEFEESQDAFDQEWAAEEEALAWLDLEDEETENYLFEEEWESVPEQVATSTPLLGGRLWSSADPILRTKHAIFVSPAAIGQGRVEVLLYVHGLLRPCGGMPTGGVASFISGDKFALGASVAGSGRPMILIVPQFQDASDKQWSTRGLDKPAVLNAYVERCLAEAGRILGRGAPELSELIVAGHSRAYGVLYPLAGSSASRAMREGPLSKLSGLWFLDASYGGFPASALAKLLTVMPGLSVKQVYIAGSPTDSFGRKKREGRLAYMPVSRGASNHCQIPAKCLADLLANRPLSVAYKPVSKRENFAPDYLGQFEDEDFDLEEEDFFDLQDEGSFAFEEEQESWTDRFDEDEDGEDFDHDMEASQSEDEAERRCSHNEALFEGIEPFMESEAWSSSPEQVAFRERVLTAHIKRTEGRKKMKAQPDLRDDQLATIPGTKIQTRKDTAIAAGKLLSAINADLAVAQAAGDADAMKIRNVSVTSGYRSASRQLNLWRGVFSAKGGYYDSTEAARRGLPGGPHSDAAIDYLLKSTASGGFGLGGRIAAPGFSNHQGGTALDFLVNLKGGGAIKHSSKEHFRAIWRRSWFHPWMQRNAARFGFRPIPTEEWHWEYRPDPTSQGEDFDAFDDEDERFEIIDQFGTDWFDENFDSEAEDEAWEASGAFEDETDFEHEEPEMAFADLAPEPYRIAGGHFDKDQKRHAATHPAGLLRTISVVGPQEKKLVAKAPYPITVGKELMRFEDGKIGEWIADYNAFTHDFEEVLRAIGRLRDLLSAGSPEAPTDLNQLQKWSFKPTDDTSATAEIKNRYRLWRNAQKEYDTTLIAIAQSEREIGRLRKDFWVAQGKLLRSIAQARRLKKPEFEGIDLRLSDLVSVATAGTFSLGVLTGAALLGDWIMEARNKREEYDKKLKEFVQATKESSQDVRDNLDAFQNAGKRYWDHVARLQDQFKGLKGREAARLDSRVAAVDFAQAIPPKSMKDGAKLAAIRMPAQVANTWRTLAIVGPRALALMMSLRRRWPIVERAVLRFRRGPDPMGLEDATQLALAAKRAESWNTVLTKEDVEEWRAVNRLWDEAYAKFYR